MGLKFKWEEKKMAKKLYDENDNVLKGAKVKKPFYKRWWFIALVVFAVIGVFGDEGDDTEDTLAEVPETEEVEIVEEVEAEEEPEVADEVDETEESVEPEEVEEEPEIVQFDPDDYNKELTFDDLARNPDEHAYKAVTFEGKIIQVIQGDGASQFRIATNDDYDKVMLIEIDNSQLESRILEDDYIRFYGTYMGEITYESTLGGNITIPGVVVEKFEFQ